MLCGKCGFACPTVFSRNLGPKKANRIGMKGNKQGGTLIELLIAIAISALVTMGAVLSISHLRHSELRREARKLKDLIQTLALISRASKTELSVTIKADGYETETLPQFPKSLHQLPAQLSITAQTIPAKLRFFPSGAATPVTFSILENGASCQLIVSLLGRCTLRCS